MTTKGVSVAEAKKHFSDLLGRVAYRGERNHIQEGQTHGHIGAGHGSSQPKGHHRIPGLARRIRSFFRGHEPNHR